MTEKQLTDSLILHQQFYNTLSQNVVDEAIEAIKIVKFLETERPLMLQRIRKDMIMEKRVNRLEDDLK